MGLLAHHSFRPQLYPVFCIFLSTKPPGRKTLRVLFPHGLGMQPRKHILLLHSDCIHDSFPSSHLGSLHGFIQPASGSSGLNPHARRNPQASLPSTARTRVYAMDPTTHPVPPRPSPTPGAGCRRWSGAVRTGAAEALPKPTSWLQHIRCWSAAPSMDVPGVRLRGLCAVRVESGTASIALVGGGFCILLRLR